MTTRHTPQVSDFSDEERALLERVAPRLGPSPAQLLQPSIVGGQAHWPAWLAANHAASIPAYRLPGTLPPLAKEAMPGAVSMTNHCPY